MNVLKAKRALEQLAQQRGVNVETVRHEMETAIAAASQSTDPKARAFWMSVPHEKEYPTPEELIVYMSETTTK